MQIEGELRCFKNFYTLWIELVCQMNIYLIASFIFIRYKVNFSQRVRC